MLRVAAWGETPLLSLNVFSLLGGIAMGGSFVQSRFGTSLVPYIAVQHLSLQPKRQSGPIGLSGPVVLPFALLPSGHQGASCGPGLGGRNQLAFSFERDTEKQP